MSRTPLVSVVVVLALGCNTEPSSLLVQIVPDTDEVDPARGIRGSDGLRVQRLSEARDLDGDTLTYRYTWSMDGQVQSDLTSEVVPADRIARDQVWTVEVVATDGKLDGEAASDEITVQNTPPVATASAEVTTVVSTESLSITGSAEDADGDEVTVEYYWTRDGEGTPLDGPTVPASFTYPGETWIGHVVGNDGTDRSEPATVTYEIENGVPVVRDVRFTEEVIAVDTELAVLVDAFDADRQPLELTYTWTVDGTQVASGVDVTRLPLGRYAKDQRVEVTVVADDGVDESEPVSASTVVVNTPPTAPEVTILPEEPIPGIDPMRCSVVTPSTDVDGDPVDYEIVWTVDGTPFTGAQTTEIAGDTVPSDQFVDEESWSCEVVPSDDDEAGPAGRAGVVPVTWKGERVFTTCGSSGARGPKPIDCDSADGYVGTTLDGEVTVADGIQEWTVPVDGTYRIEARGAEGAFSSSAGSVNPGDGAIVRGDFDLARGTVLRIAVGQPGSDSSGDAGGGGASWVMFSDDSPVLVAGGGGSSSWYGVSARRDGCDALTGRYGGQGSGTSTSSPASTSCAAKSGGLRAGGDVPSTFMGNGGGGVDSDGRSGGSGTGGSSWLNGVEGGGGGGGFGAGGGGTLGSWGAGGGGGWSGGDAGRMLSGGGGSYNEGDNPSSSVGNTGDGEVSIDWLGF